ncbi:MAG: hypothetical protein LBV12_07460 [Puniceicoccales bacterium]|jgi:hypothetical protein|nr:hypothetical protein [Puniceicoccales bacterium]
MKENPSFEEYLIGLCQGLLADGELSPAKVIYFKCLLLKEYSFVQDLSGLGDLIKKVYDFAKELPEDESSLTDEMCDAMLGCV